MQYYKVNAKSDQIRPNPNKAYILIANELYTKSQIDSMGVSDIFIQKHFKIVDISRKKTYYFFGARFSQKN